MVDINMYRLKIGCFKQPAQRRFRIDLETTRNSTLNINRRLILIILYTLVISNIIEKKKFSTRNSSSSDFTENFVKNGPNSGFSEIKSYFGPKRVLGPNSCNFYARYTYGNRNRGIK